MTDMNRFASSSLLFVVVCSIGCSDPGPVECIVVDDASAADAVASESCEIVRIQGGSFTDLTAFANLRRELTLSIERADALETTSGLPVLRNIEISGAVPALGEIVLTVDQGLSIAATPADSITVTYPVFDPPEGGGQRSLALFGALPSSVSVTFEDQTPLYALFLRDVAEDFTIDASPSLPHVERFDWVRTVPADLAVLQQFGRPSVQASFSLLADETYPLIVNYVAWLREEAPNTKIGLNDENGAPLELADIGVTE
jgi:hypothetical protein